MRRLNKSLKKSELLAYISEQESIIRSQSREIQKLATELALHEALKETEAADE